MLEEGKTDTEITLEKQKARTDEKIVNRAKDVIAMLE